MHQQNENFIKVVRFPISSHHLHSFIYLTLLKERYVDIQSLTRNGTNEKMMQYDQSYRI